MKNKDTAAKVARVQQLMQENPLRSQRSACAAAGIKEQTYRYHKSKIVTPDDQSTGPEPAKNDGKSATSRPTAVAITEEAVLEEHGIDPDEVVIKSGRASRWGSPDDPQHQLRVNYERKENLVQLPDPSTWEPPDLGVMEEFSDGLVLFRSDPHLPFNNAPLNRAVLRFINLTGVQKIVFVGDLADNSNLSKHRTHPRFRAMVNHTNDAVARYLWETRMAAPAAEIVILPGNHDARIPYYVQDKAPELEGVRPGSLPGDEELPAEALGFRELWRLDELGIDLIDEDWKLASHNVAPELTVRHGYLTGNNSERKLLETHGRSQVHGHDHRGTVTYRTKHDPLDIRVAMSCGTEAEVEPDGLGYQPDPDWTPGVGLAHVWDDGDFVVNFAPFINNNLLLPSGERISGEE